MDIAQKSDDLDPAMIQDFDMFNLELVHGEYQLAVKAFQKPQTPEIFWTPRNGGHWVTSRSESVNFVLNNPEIFSSKKAYVPKEKNPAVGYAPMMMDAPDHRKYRALLAPVFSPKYLQKYCEMARARCIELAEQLEPRGECEFISEFAQKLPIDIFISMTDLPLEDRDMLVRMGEIHVRPPSKEAHMENARQMHDYVVNIVNQRRGGAGTDLITQLTKATVDGVPIDEEILIGMVHLVMLGGLDTVASSLGFMALFLARSPEHRRQLIEKPELIPHAVDELLRRWAMSSVGRILTQDYDYKGTQMRAGDMIIVPLIFAGLDERVHANPLDVDFSRTDVSHNAFGAGAHRCIGSMLGKQELRIFFEEFLPRIPDFAVKPGADPRPVPGTVSGFRSLPLVWTPRAS